MISSSSAASATVRAIGPAVERPMKSGLKGPDVTRPRVGLIPKTPQAAAGMRMEPPPSLPWAAGARPAATAEAAPPLEPPAERERSQGVRAAGAMAVAGEQAEPHAGVSGVRVRTAERGTVE